MLGFAGISFRLAEQTPETGVDMILWRDALEDLGAGVGTVLAGPVRESRSCWPASCWCRC